MMQFQDAREAFRNNPTGETALLLHRVAWRAYVDGRISESDFTEAMEQVDLFITPAPSVEHH
jgi:hypothetical protein